MSDPKPKSKIERIAELHKLRLDLEQQQAQDIEQSRYEDILPTETESERFDRIMNNKDAWR